MFYNKTIIHWCIKHEWRTYYWKSSRWTSVEIPWLVSYVTLSNAAKGVFLSLLEGRGSCVVGEVRVTTEEDRVTGFSRCVTWSFLYSSSSCWTNKQHCQNCPDRHAGNSLFVCFASRTLAAGARTICNEVRSENERMFSKLFNICRLKSRDPQ